MYNLLPTTREHPLGAALWVGSEEGKKRPDVDFTNVYLGPEYDDQEIERAIRSEGHEVPTKSVKVEQDTARLLREGKVIGWFQGRMEAGPRALGNRSILAHPGLDGLKRKVNVSIKNRENWRPFAPSILEEDAPEILNGFRISPFMTVSFQS